MTDVFLSLGSNKGDRLKYLNEALNFLNRLKNSSVQKVASIYETLPLGFEEQENFYNTAVLLKTELNPFELLRQIKEIEKEVGRTKSFRWGPREIDIDILLFGNSVIETEELTVPHKYLTERDFAIVPLLEIKDDVIHPVSKKNLSNYLALIDSKQIIHKFVFWKNNFSGEEIVRH